MGYQIHQCAFREYYTNFPVIEDTLMIGKLIHLRKKINVYETIVLGLPFRMDAARFVRQSESHKP